MREKHFPFGWFSSKYVSHNVFDLQIRPTVFLTTVPHVALFSSVFLPSLMLCFSISLPVFPRCRVHVHVYACSLTSLQSAGMWWEEKSSINKSQSYLLSGPANHMLLLLSTSTKCSEREGDRVEWVRDGERKRYTNRGMRGERERGEADKMKKKKSKDKRERQWKEDQREEEWERGFCRTKIDQVKWEN